MKTAALNNKDILSYKLRFEAEHYLNDNSFLCLALERNKDNCDTLENLATVFILLFSNVNFANRHQSLFNIFRVQMCKMQKNLAPSTYLRDKLNL